jgi:6-phosphogluconolactonase
MHIVNRCSVALAIVVPLAIHGCGGGTGSGSGLSPPVRPASVAAHFVYILNSGSDNISAFAIDPASGVLAAISGSPFLTGMSPYTMTISPSGGYAYVSNAGSNNISAYSIAAATGVLSELSGSPYLVSPFSSPLTFPISRVAIDPTGRYAFVTNASAPEVDVVPALLSQPNNLFAYSIASSSGELQSAPGSPYTTGGFLPIDVSVDGSGEFVYVLNQYPQIGAEGSSISAFAINASNGSLTAIAGSPFLNAAQNPALLSLTIDPADPFIYVSCSVGCFNAGFSINPTGGGLTNINLSASTSGPIASGLISSQAFLTTSSGKYLYLITPSGICGQQVDGSTGSLTQVNCSALPNSSGATMPQSSQLVAADPLGSFVFVANYGAKSLSVFSIDSANGSLSQVTGSPFAAGTTPSAVVVEAKGSLLYVTNSGSNNISAYVVVRPSGELVPVPGSPFATGNGPGKIVLL